MIKKEFEGYTLWFSNESGRADIYLLPVKSVFMIGFSILYNLKGQKKHFNIDELKQYICTEEKALLFLRNQWNEALNEAKESWLQLNQFAKMTGLGQDVEELKKSFLHGLESSGANVNQAFDFGKNFVEQFQQAVKNGDLQDKETQQEAFKKIFKNFPEILSYFEEEKLEAAAKNPEVWAKELYQKAFGAEEKKKIEKRKEQLKNDVRASIAEGLRKAGIKPAEDFNKTK